MFNELTNDVIDGLLSCVNPENYKGDYDGTFTLLF